MKSIIHFLLIVCVFYCVACATLERPPLLEKNGKKYGKLDKKFTATFEDHYKIGQDYAKGGFWEAAKQQFMIAKSKQNFDDFKTPTEGMHYIDYFPHREIGILHYYQGNTSEALKYLEQSIKFKSSPRAVYYLNCVRRAISQKQAKDKQAPSIAVHFPDAVLVGKKYFTQKYNMPVSAQVSDNDYVQAICLNHKAITVEKFSPEISVNEIVSLTAGENTIHITATDVSGNVSEIKHNIVLDIMGPVISISSKFDELEQSALLKGLIMDQSGIQKLDIIVNGTIYPYPIEPDMNQVELSYPLPQKTLLKSIQVDAQDRLGNESSIVVFDKYAKTLSSKLMLASNGFFSAKAVSGKKPVIIIKDYEKINELITRELPVLIEINHREDIESVIVVLNNEEIIESKQYQHKSNNLYLAPRLCFKDGKNTVQIIVNPDSVEPIKKTFRFRVHEQIRKQWSMKVALFPHKDTVITRQVRENLKPVLEKRFKVDSRIKSEQDYKQHIKQGCVGGFVTCDGNQATLWSVSWYIGEISKDKKPALLVKQDNPQEYEKWLKLLRIIKGNDIDLVPLRSCTANLYINNHQGDNLISTQHYYETIEENLDQIVKTMCEYLSNKLINEMPVPECFFIHEILQDKQALLPDINPKVYHIKKGMRMIVFKPTYNNNREDRSEIAEAEVQEINKLNQVEASLCNPNFFHRVNTRHQVILR